MQKKIVNSLKRERGGIMRHRSYAERSIGSTEQWNVTKKMYDFHVKRLGFNVEVNRFDEEKQQGKEQFANVVQQKLF